jgi:hypothetical protein
MSDLSAVLAGDAPRIAPDYALYLKERYVYERD